ncbi:hypothetical protein Riv7116_5600 [Rivularia sp. PCC 7116]|uniref:hypothetical protein n=1 Tax=Rivularia sp. PCC 7116 TaxID=373994 RepID=UPI00029F127A|nr:hypothetical protein [Rivularia sp. PCC 7116]AFY57969.1 hypothetical protein Riv7116_5600 [Rivularia sp. PCC 7116]
MKVLSKVLLITLLAAIFGLTGCNQSKFSEVNKSVIPLPAIKSYTAENSARVVFPQKANVRLIGGASKIGWVNINLQTKQIEVTLNNNSETFDFNRIKKVNFDLNRAIFSDGDILIKGEKLSDFIRESLIRVPMSDLKLENEAGEVTVKLNNSESSQNYVVRDGIYVVQDILFDESLDRTTLKVLCCMAE